MKLWRVENGYMGNGEVQVLVIADTSDEALGLARESFKAEQQRFNAQSYPNDVHGGYGSDYYESLREPELLCADTTQPWASEPHD